MRKTFLALASLAALIALPACAYDEGGYGSSARYSYYDGYYDNYYGPVWSGYWGPDEYFYYSPARGKPFVRDDGHHFRRDVYDGYHHFHMRDYHGRG